MFKQKLYKPLASFFQNRKLFTHLTFLGLCLFSLSSSVIAQGNGACENIKVTGVFNEDPNSDYFQGITIENFNAPIQIIKIYNSNWELIEECAGDCNSLTSYETEADKYYVQIQLYTENWEWICQTDNIEVIVPTESTPPPSDCGLEIISAIFPLSVEPGETINLQATIRNNSTTTDATTSSIGLYQLRGGSKAPPTPQLIAETPIGYLASGESSVFNFSATLPNPLWNQAGFPIGDDSPSNNFVFLTKENSDPINAFNCNFPVDFTVDYPEVDLALSLENNEGCIDDQGIIQTDLRVTNLSGITAKVPIYLDLGQECSFGNPTVTTCKVHFSSFRAYAILNEDLAPNQSILIEKPFKTPNTFITEWEVNGKIDALGSALEDSNEENNQVTATFTKTEDCIGTSPTPDCRNITAAGNGPEAIGGGAPSGIYIDGASSANTVIRVYTNRWELVKECSTCQLPYFAGFPPGDYIIQVQLFGENWEWICQTNNILVNVPTGQTCLAIFFRDADGDGFGNPADGVSGCEPPIGYVNNADDCNDNDPNIGAKQAQGTACDDGNSDTINDVIQADGCSCQGSPDIGTPSCDVVSILRLETFAPTPGVALYNVSSLTAPIEIVKIFNRRTYENLFECNNDCGNDFDIELEEGEYVAQIQMYTANWEWICGKDIEFDVVIGDPGPVTCDIVENINFDNLCNECIGEIAAYEFEGRNYIVYLFDNTNCADGGNDIYDCETGEFFCTEGGFTFTPNTCGDFFATAIKKETIWAKSSDCPSCTCTQELDPVCGSDGVTYGNPCLAECAGVSSWIRGECPTNTPDCNKVRAKVQIGLQDTYEGLGIEGLNAPIEIIKIYDANWNQVYECSSDCANPTVLPLSDLSPGLYRIHVQMYTADWQQVCETDFLEVTVPENAGSRAGKAFIDEKAITLFPNPVQHILKLKTNAFQGKAGSIQIFNTFGQQVADIPQKKFNQTFESIDISGYQNGLYFMTIKVEHQRVISKKFFVEKLE